MSDPDPSKLETRSLEAQSRPTTLLVSTCSMSQALPLAWQTLDDQKKLKLIRRPSFSWDPACESKPLLFWISVEMFSPLSSESVFREVRAKLGQPNLRTLPLSAPSLLLESPNTATGTSWATLERSGSLRNDIQKENLKKWSLLEPPARLRKGSRCSESSIFIFCKDLTLVPFLHPLGTPKWVSALHDGYPGGPFCSI